MASNNMLTTENVCISFIYSLVPISLAYHLAHFLSYLLIQGQLIVPLSSDPFGYGWDLFGGADYKLNIGIIGAKFAWVSAVISIVVGHIIAVYIAHVVAMKKLGNRKTAIQSQIPMLGLMIVYTISSLELTAGFASNHAKANSTMGCPLSSANFDNLDNMLKFLSVNVFSLALSLPASLVPSGASCPCKYLPVRNPLARG